MTFGHGMKELLCPPIRKRAICRTPKFEARSLWSTERFSVERHEGRREARWRPFEV
jgi:hypothetical protein